MLVEPIFRHIAWKFLEGEGLEYATLGAHFADGSLIGKLPGYGTPFFLHYLLTWDDSWRLHTAKIRFLSEDKSKVLELKSDGAGHWHDGEGRGLPRLEGAEMIDIAFTPFTNIFPLRLKDWNIGQSREFSVAYIAFPDLDMQSDKQAYTYLENRGENRLFRYESRKSGFTADILVDNQGLVIDYPRHWRRL